MFINTQCFNQTFQFNYPPLQFSTQEHEHLSPSRSHDNNMNHLSDGGPITKESYLVGHKEVTESGEPVRKQTAEAQHQCC